MFSFWKCQNCGLCHDDTKQSCQACFTKTTDFTPLQSIDHHQKVLFDGFIRLKIINHLNKSRVPMDIINLCYKFYSTDIKKLYSSDHHTTQDIVELAMRCWKVGDGFISYQLSNLAKTDDNKGYSHYLMGKILHQWKEYERAELSFKASLNIAKHRNKIKCHYRYGLLLQSQRKHDLALIQFQNAFNSSKQAEHAYECAYSYHKLENYTESEKLYIKAIKLNRNKCKYRYRYGKLLKDMKKYKKSIIEFNKATKLKKIDEHRLTKCIAHTADCYTKLKDTKNASKSWQKILKKHPKNTSHRTQYALMWRNNKRYSKALEQFMKLIELAPDRAEYVLEAAYCYEQLKDKENAEMYYSRAIELDTTSKSTNWYAQWLRDEIHDYDKAATYFRKCIRIEPTKCNNYYQYGSMLQTNMRDYKTALRQYLSALKVEPNNAKYTLQCAICYEKLKEYENAGKFYLRAIEINDAKEFGKEKQKQREVKYLNWYGVFLRDHMSNYGEAGKYFLKAIEVKPKDPSAYYHYARMLRDYIKDYKGAEAYYLKCMEVSPKRHGAHGSYGYLLYLMGEYERAIEQIEIEVNEISDNNMWAYFYYGLVNDTIGDKDKADAALWRAIGVMDVKDSEEVMRYLRSIKGTNEQNVDYHEKFERMVDDKLNLLNDNVKCYLI